MPTLTPATAATGTLSAAPTRDGTGLYCSETLACSDTDVTCTDADGFVDPTTSNRTLVAA